MPARSAAAWPRTAVSCEARQNLFRRGGRRRGAIPLRPGGEGVDDSLRLAARQELNLIKETVGLRAIGLVGEFVPVTPRSLPDIINLLPDIIHISCPVSEGAFYFEDEQGGPLAVQADWLASYLHDHEARTAKRNCP
jgi:hypothetical protein